MDEDRSCDYWLDGKHYYYTSTGGNQMWTVDGKLHRDDGPAIESSNGDRFWYDNGKMIASDCPTLMKRPLNNTKPAPALTNNSELYPAKYLIVGVIIALIIANIVAHFL